MISREPALLVRLYPIAWRARYGEELEALILETAGDRISWRVRRNVATAAAREHLRNLLGRTNQTPREALSASLPTMLWAWLLVAIGGGVVGKTSEHWAGATPAPIRALPEHASGVFVAGAMAGSGIIVVGMLVALPATLQVIRQQRHILARQASICAAITLLLVVATFGLAAWAHTLTSAQRNGHDELYGFAFVSWALWAVVTLGAWTRLGTSITRRLELTVLVLQAEAVLSTAAALAMAAVTVGAVLWWVTLAHSAPWVLTGRTASSHGSGIAGQLVLATFAMASGTVLAASASIRSVRAASHLKSTVG